MFSLGNWGTNAPLASTGVILLTVAYDAKGYRENGPCGEFGRSEPVEEFMEQEQPSEAEQPASPACTEQLALSPGHRQVPGCVLQPRGLRSGLQFHCHLLY